MFSSHQGNRETIETPAGPTSGVSFSSPCVIVSTAIQLFDQHLVETGRGCYLRHMAFACKLDQPRSRNQLGCLLPKYTVVTDLRLDIGRGNEALLCIKKGLA